MPNSTPATPTRSAVRLASFVVRVLDCGNHVEYVVRNLRSGEEQRFVSRQAFQCWLSGHGRARLR